MTVSYTEVHEISLLRNGGRKTEGILGLTEEESTEEDSASITLEVVTRLEPGSIYTSCVTADALKQNSSFRDAPDPIKKLKSVLLPKASNSNPPTSPATGNAHLQAKFEVNNESVRVGLSKTLSSGLVRIVWEATLSVDNSRTAFDFARSALNTGTGSQSKYADIQSKCERLQEARDNWKDTAEKLENGWTKEKNELLQNFLSLYHKQQDMTKDAEAKVQELTAALQAKEEELKEAKSRKRARTASDDQVDETNEATTDKQSQSKPKPAAKVRAKPAAKPKAKPKAAARSRSKPTLKFKSSKGNKQAKLDKSVDSDAEVKPDQVASAMEVDEPDVFTLDFDDAPATTASVRNKGRQTRNQPSKKPSRTTPASAKPDAAISAEPPDDIMSEPEEPDKPAQIPESKKSPALNLKPAPSKSSTYVDSDESDGDMDLEALFKSQPKSESNEESPPRPKSREKMSTPESSQRKPRAAAKQSPPKRAQQEVANDDSDSSDSDTDLLAQLAALKNDDK